MMFEEIADHATAVVNLCDYINGFERASFVRRFAAGHAVHGGYFHIGTGLDYQRQVIVDGDYRTKDFVVAERAVEPTGKVPVCFQEMASASGLLWRGPGFDRYPLVGGDDGTTNVTVSSADGAPPWVQDGNAPTVPYECGLLLDTPVGLVAGLGLSYRVSPPPTYDINKKIWRRSTNGLWTQVQANMPALRSFAQIQWDGRTILFGGADDSAYPNRVDFNGAIISDDSFTTYQIISGVPWGPVYGMRAARFGNWCVLIGGGTGSPVVFSNKVWVSQTPWVPASFVRGPDLPIAVMHVAAGSLVVNGVETLAVIGGYNDTARPDGSPYGTIYTTTDLAQWTAKTNSDFWLDP